MFLIPYCKSRVPMDAKFEQFSVDKLERTIMQKYGIFLQIEWKFLHYAEKEVHFFIFVGFSYTYNKYLTEQVE